MHELGVVFHIIDSLEEVAKENDVTQIQSITIEIGEVSTVIPHYLTDCWEWAIKKKESACLRDVLSLSYDSGEQCLGATQPDFCLLGNPPNPRSAPSGRQRVL